MQYLYQKKETKSVENKMEDKSTWAIGGGTLLGLGIGFFFLGGNRHAFVGSLLGGIGAGLIITSIISRKKA